MKYIIVYTKSALEDIKKLDPIIKKRVGKKIQSYSQNPVVYSKALTHASIGGFRWRIGNYRIVFDIEKNHIIILRIGHRREIYR